MLRSRALLSSASGSPTLDELAALQGGYSSDSDASTVLLDEGPRSPAGPPVPQWSPTTATALDPIFGHAEPIIVSEVDPRAGHDMSNPIDRIIRREKDRMQLMRALDDPAAKVHAMDLHDIWYNLHQLTWYVKSNVPALRHLSGLTPGPGESINFHLGMSLPGSTVGNICFLLDQLSWIVGERSAIQREAGSHKTDYLAVYRSHFAKKMDISVFDSEPRKLPPAPKRTRVSSYRRSLGSLFHFGNVKAVRGRISGRHRPIRQARVGGASGTKIAAASSSREQSPEI